MFRLANAGLRDVFVPSGEARRLLRSALVDVGAITKARIALTHSISLSHSLSLSLSLSLSVSIYIYDYLAGGGRGSRAQRCGLGLLEVDGSSAEAQASRVCVSSSYCRADQIRA